jgi:hypothetical protein
VLTNSISKPKRTSSLHTPSNILNLRLLLALEPKPSINFTKVLLRQILEARHNALARELLDGLDAGLFGYLDLQSALSEAEAKFFGNVVFHAGFEDDIVPCDAEVDVTLSDEGGDVGGGEEDAV